MAKDLISKDRKKLSKKSFVLPKKWKYPGSPNRVA
jgi:hypothetical protein